MKFSVTGSGTVTQQPGRCGMVSYGSQFALRVKATCKNLPDERVANPLFLMNASAVTMVMLPGLHGSTRLFESALAVDWGGMRTCALALADQGPQDYEALATGLSATLPAGELVLLAESFSTPLAMRLAAGERARVKALVLVSGFCASPQPGGLGWLPLQPILSLTPPVFLLKQFLTGDEASPQLLASLTDATGRAPAATLAERVRVVLALREADCPSLTGLPVLLLQARRDRVIPWDAQSQLERHFPEATCHWIDGPHLLLQTRTRECREAVLEFLAGMPPAATSPRTRHGRS